MTKLNDLALEANQGLISRREFLSRAAALGLTSATAMSLLGRAAEASVPKRGGVLKIALGGGGSPSDKMDPTTAFDAVNYFHLFTTYNTLVEVNSKKELVPELAESWEPNDDMSVWTFNLRSGVQFHDGKPLVAEDVVYSIMLHLAKDSKSAAKGFLLNTERVEAVGERQVRVILKNPDADLPYLMGEYHMCIVPNGYTNWMTANGTGPYKLIEFEPGIRSRWERNPNYWKSDRAWVDQVEMLVINDTTARTVALRTGDVHYINRIDTKTAALVKRDAAIDLNVSPGQMWRTAAMRVTQDPFKDRNVRLAMKYAFDREQLLNILLKGYGYASNDHPIVRSDPYFHSELPLRPYDPDKAKWHLKQAGQEGLEVNLSASDSAFSQAVDAAQLCQEAVKRAGIKMNVIREPSDGYWSDIWMKKPFFMSNWFVRPTAAMILSMVFTSDAPWNESDWRREDFDQLLRQAQKERDFGKRKQLYWTMQEMIHEDSGNIIPVFADAIDAYRAELKGVAPDAVGEVMGSRIAERVWLA